MERSDVLLRRLEFEGHIVFYSDVLGLDPSKVFVVSSLTHSSISMCVLFALESTRRLKAAVVVVGIKRTNKPFSKREVDFTVESTINADAAKRSTDIACMKNSISARQRWSKSHAVRTEIISHVLAEVPMKKREEFTNDLRKSKIEKSQLQIQQFEDSINKRLNPFPSSLNDNLLYNISDGQSASHASHTIEIKQMWHLEKIYIVPVIVSSTGLNPKHYMIALRN
ncbi:hypothetical protein HHI36_022255 [Cryptolaemus montrouzieri]|uniref:Uncharacterized protein n=1 Tax=Cryptolaemus montrouzieri TaxID=559131 RepID=A0ABD2MZ99_9CUCU